MTGFIGNKVSVWPYELHRARATVCTSWLLSSGGDALFSSRLEQFFFLSQNKANPTNKKKDSKKNKTRKKGHVKKQGNSSVFISHLCMAQRAGTVRSTRPGFYCLAPGHEADWLEPPVCFPSMWLTVFNWIPIEWPTSWTEKENTAVEQESGELWTRLFQFSFVQVPCCFGFAL